MSHDLVVLGEVAIDELRDSGEVRAGGAAYAADAAAATGARVALAGQVPGDLPEYEVRRLRRRGILFTLSTGTTATRYVMSGTSPLARRTTERISGSAVPELPPAAAGWLLALASEGLQLPAVLAQALKSGAKTALDGHDDQMLSPDARSAIQGVDLLFLNWSTLRALTGEASVENALARVGRKSGSTIVKHGRGGVTLIDGDRRVEIGTVVTRKGIKVGAGDTLAGTVVGLLAQGEPLDQAVHVGVRAAAAFIESGSASAMPKSAVEGLDTYVAPERMAREVYVAGPFFTRADVAVLSELEFALEAAGLAYFSPRLRAGILTPTANQEQRERTYRADIEALESAPAVVALLDGDDAGTAWEVGYAVASQKPVVGLYTDVRGGPDNMIQMSVARQTSIEAVIDDLFRVMGT